METKFAWSPFFYYLCPVNNMETDHVDDDIPSVAITGHCVCELACVDAGAVVGCVAMVNNWGGDCLFPDAVSQPYMHHR